MTDSAAVSDPRTPAQLHAHYTIERELADKLRSASRQERRHLYSAVYDELYRRVPTHPLLTRKLSHAQVQDAVNQQIAFLGRFIHDTTTFLEIGAGDCALSIALAPMCRQVYAIDVSDEITKAAAEPANFQLILSDGCSIPVAPASVNVAYSNQLMEHLHPSDALEQL